MSMNTRFSVARRLAFVSLLGLPLAACNNAGEGALSGAAIGAGSGAAIGAIAGGGTGAWMGAAIGAVGGGVGGAVIGDQNARRQEEQNRYYNGR